MPVRSLLREHLAGRTAILWLHIHKETLGSLARIQCDEEGFIAEARLNRFN